MEGHVIAETPHPLEKWSMLGEIVYLILEIPQFIRAPVGNISIWIIPPLELNQICGIYDVYGGLVGFFSWAYLTEEIGARIKSNDTYVPHLADWCEGENIWIMSVVAKKGAFARYGVSALKKNFPKGTVLNWLNRGHRHMHRAI